MSSTGAALQRTPLLAERVADELRQAIATGTFRAGDRLPTEREMSDTYGVSRAIVREAMGRLKHDGLIVSRQGSGAYVAEGIAPTLRLRVVPSDADDLRDVVELLSAIRSAASAHAATRRTPAQLAAIRRWYDAIDAAVRAGQPGEDEDIGFHQAIVDAAGNPLFNQILVFLDSRVRHFVRTARTNSRQWGLTEQVQREHCEMLDAIAHGDAEKARQAAERHLANALERLATGRKRRLRPPAKAL